MSLINPYKVNVKKLDITIESIENSTDEVANILVENQADLITQVQEERKSRALLEAEIRKIISERKLAVGDYDAFIDSVFDTLFGYGLLQPYLYDPDVSDILVNSYNNVFIKKFGKKINVPVNFGSEENLVKYCYKIAAMCGGKLDESSNIESVLTDRKRNLRIVISLKPVNVKSPSICIRKPTTGFSLDELVGKGMLTNKQKDYFKKAVLDQKTIVIAGKGGSGKSTLLGALINEVPHSERGLLIQETFEINPKHPDIVCKLVKLSDNPEVKNYTLFELTKIGLLMSMDRIFIGELKDKETMDFFNAVYTGHLGSMATVHANSAKEVIKRLILLMKKSGTDIPFEELKNMLASSLDIIVFLKNYKVVEIFEVSEEDVDVELD
mgnify:FL=1